MSVRCHHPRGVVNPVAIGNWSLTVERMTPDDATPGIDRVVRGHVEDVVRRLLTPDELEKWELRWELNEGRWQLVVDNVACAERYLGFITERDADYPMGQGLDTFTDGLEDFISESRFARGQRRELRERPWRTQAP
jgi:hypothetical protein